MLSKSVKNIKKGDYFRVLVTETIPYETPLIFSNDGFYSVCQSIKNKPKIILFIFDRLVIGEKSPKSYTIPYQYKIRKNTLDFRRLSVVHPISQWKMKLFYEKYEKLICHFCEKSNFSIRSPSRVASIFYYKSSWENIRKYKMNDINNIDSELKIKHSSSFYSYRGYDRLYKFFNSPLFISLEKKFPTLRTLDVSKCFDSIYTHSIAWAIKEKQFVKSKVAISSTFGQSFDTLMQSANYNETNGIIIGPEISRIFAELIFQDIDTTVQNRLAEKNILLDIDYSIKRYVDDVFIFSKDDTIGRKIYEIYSDCLTNYNLHVNSSKSTYHQRPFFTSKSRVIRDLNIKVNDFSDKFLISVQGNSIIIPKEIHKKDQLIHNFIDSIKSTCASNSVGYDDVSSYLISAFFERVKRLININKDEIDKVGLDKYKDAVLVFIDVMFFFYSVSPSVNSSYKLCASIILLSRFSKQLLGPYENTIKQRIFELTIELLCGDLKCRDSDVDNFIFLEESNVILSISDMGEDYLLPADLIKNIFDKTCSYYDLVTCLFYIKNHKIYDDIRNSIIEKIEKELKDMSKIQIHTEQALLLLDSLSCPYINQKIKKKWIVDFYAISQEARPSKDEIKEFLTSCENILWFINWQEIDLLNALERKELRYVY